MIISSTKYFVQGEYQNDGGLESLLKIVKHYKGNIFSKNLNNVIQNNYTITSTQSLINTASKFGLLAAVHDDIDIHTMINYNQPLIIGTTTTTNNIYFVVCYSYSEENGFLIWDSRNGTYYASIDGLKSIRSDKKCIAFSKIKSVIDLTIIKSINSF